MNDIILIWGLGYIPGRVGEAGGCNFVVIFSAHGCYFFMEFGYIFILIQ